ncbi:MAG: glycosyltransferase [Akkermansia sp.]|nr:glycosyltransferase [Akkermansia sp.]
MPESPLISVIVPVYNSAAFLSATLDSICNQTYRNLEIILVNDGSTDTSPAILEKYAAKDQRIKVINQMNAGQAAARNRGIEAATGKYIQFLDSDDLFESNMIQILVEASEKNDSEITICDTVSEVVATGEKIYGKHLNADLAIKHLNPALCCPQKSVPGLFFQIFCSCVCWNRLYLTSFIRRYNILFPINRDDLCIGYKSILLANRISVIPQKLVHYQIRKTSVSHGDRHNLYVAPAELSDLHDFIQKQNFHPDLMRAFYPRATCSLVWNILNISKKPAEICDYINHCSSQLPYLFHHPYAEQPLANYPLNACLRSFEAIFYPEIQLILPALSPEHHPQVFARVQKLVNLRESPGLAVRVLYAREDDSPLPFDLLDYPVAMPICVEKSATMDERISACKQISLPPCTLTLCPGSSPAPILDLAKKHKKELLKTRLQRVFTFSHTKKTQLQQKSRFLRNRIKGMNLLLDIIQTPFS